MTTASTFDWYALLFTGLRILLVLILAWIALALVKLGLRRFQARLLDKRREAAGAEAAKRADTLVRLLHQAALILVWVVVGLLVLRQLGIDIGPILASAGIAGLAVGFGAQHLVRDVIAGFFFILEDQVRVGDVAIINGTGGLVEQLNFRTLVLRDLAGTVHIFPNGTITTLSNMTHEWSAYIFEVDVAYKEDTDRVVGIMKQVGAEMLADPHLGPLMLEDIDVFGVDRFAESSVVIKGRLKTLPIKQWEVGREFRRRLKQAFDAAGVELPFPHRTVYFGEASKPFDVRLKEAAAAGRGASDPAQG